MTKSKKTKKLNTDLDEVANVAGVEEVTIVPESTGNEDSEDLMSYTMGKIEAEDSEDDEKEEFDKAAKTVTSNNTDEDDPEWVEDEEFNDKDEDSFLDEANWEPDDIVDDEG